MNKAKYVYHRDGIYQVLLAASDLNRRKRGKTDYMGSFKTFEEAVFERNRLLKERGEPIPKDSERMPAGIKRINDNSFEARIQSFLTIDGVKKNRTVYIGRFNTIEEAVYARTYYKENGVKLKKKENKQA